MRFNVLLILVEDLQDGMESAGVDVVLDKTLRSGGSRLSFAGPTYDIIASQ